MVKSIEIDGHIQPHPDSDPAVAVAALGDYIWLITPRGGLEAEASRRMQTVIEARINVRRSIVIIDMAAVDEISREALRMLISVWQRARAAKCDILLAHVVPHIGDVLKLVGFDLLFSIFDTVEEAVASASRK